jgi:hypothetical protein
MEMTWFWFGTKPCRCKHNSQYIKILLPVPAGRYLAVKGDASPLTDTSYALFGMEMSARRKALEPKLDGCRTEERVRHDSKAWVQRPRAKGVDSFGRVNEK